MRLYFIISIVCSALIMQLGCSGDHSTGNTTTVQVQTIEAENPPAAAGLTEFASAVDALAEGNRLFENGETVQAIDVLLQAVKLDPDLAEAYFKLGIAYALVEAEDDKVTGPVETPTPKNKKTKEVKTNSEKAFKNAVRGYKKILAANKDDDVAHFNLGLAYNKLNEDGDAAKSIREAVRLKPEDTLYQTELGSILMKLAKYHEAVAVLKNAIELDSTNVEAEELLEKAEAGRKRIDFTSLPRDGKKSITPVANGRSETDEPGSNTVVKPSKTKVSPPKVPEKTPK